MPLFPILKTLQQPTYGNILTLTWIVVTILLGIVWGIFYYRNWSSCRKLFAAVLNYLKNLAIRIATALDEKLATRLDPTFGDLLKAIEQLASTGSSVLGRTISSQMGAEIESLSKTLETVVGNLRSLSDCTPTQITP